MQAASLIFSIFAISISSIDLALAIVWGLKAEYKWSKFLVVFMATVLGLAFSYVLFAFADLLFSGTALYVFSLIWEILFVADVSFLFVFIPIFINWVIARPFPLVEKLIFSAIAGAYLVCSILNFIWPESAIFSKVCLALFLPVIIYTVGVMARARREIAEKDARHVSFTIEIVSLSVMPLLIVSIVIPAFYEIAIPLVALAYFIMVMVFLFYAISKQRRSEVVTKEEKEDARKSIIEEYHITDREMEVINLIKKGFSNKEIASELNISVNTVNNHISNAFTKTGVRCRIDLLNLLKEASW